MTTARIPAGWHGTIAEFLNTTQKHWFEKLCIHHLQCMNESPNESQQKAWSNCVYILQRTLATLIIDVPISKDWIIIFEYELPRERGRRPDVIILAGDTVLIIEFKDYSQILQSHVDQVTAYARDLQHYHAATHNLKVIPILMLTMSKSLSHEQDDIHIVGPIAFVDLIKSLLPQPSALTIDTNAWINADYAPLPSMVSAARSLFEHEPLPQIHTAQSAGIPNTINKLFEIADYAQTHQELHLALVTGVPGAGKTLVGLQFVYTNHFGDTGSERTSVFLSGNGPLVKVLQHALKSSIFVQDVHGFLRDYGGSQSRKPNENIWVYDEAQRAWDAERVQEKRGHNASEPEDFLRIGERMNSWALMIGLIGEGQEIHLGEEAGLSQWNDAIAKMSGKWHVHCPEKVAHIFTAASTVITAPELNLTKSLRSHLAEDIQKWVRLLLEGDITTASKVATNVKAQGFDMYITRDIDVAKAYVQERYLYEENKRYGLLGSSKANNLVKYGINTTFNFTKNLREGPWYNDPPESKYSCCALHDVATEFACQGLELDFPIVGWGDDLIWSQSSWKSIPQARSKAHDPHQLRVNSYRVLLSRSRDGFIIFVPDEVIMNDTYEALINAGMQLLR